MIRTLRFILVSVATTAGLLLVILLARAFDSRGVLDLGPEYKIEFESEFRASDEEDTDWAGYHQIEKLLDEELAAHIDNDARPDSLLDRYSENSLTHPDSFDGNWNHSFEMKNPASAGVAVMLHGLSDSPYSMLPTAQALYGAGYDVVVPRMPGHGYAVSGLLDASWEDWTAATRIAIRYAASLREPGDDFLLAGYSNGALLALNYALTCRDVDDLPCPDRIVMLSPAIAVSSAARFANWHVPISWMPYFEKLKWLSLLPEIDPFKFTSFPNRAAHEIFEIAKRTHKLLADASSASQLPPILTFQSVVDNTVSASAVLSILYEKLPANGSRLVVYDINRNSTVTHLMQNQPGDPLDYFVSVAPFNFDLTILRNSKTDKFDVVATHIKGGETSAEIETTTLEWPIGVYSLSHIALPFPPYDDVYGELMKGGRAGAVIGDMIARGEPGLLSLAPAYFLRLRNNPFYAYQVQVLNRWLDDTG